MVSPRQTHEVCGACPLDRPDGCSWVVTVEAGVPTRLRGAVEPPFSRGSLCNKVAGYLEHTRAPGRLLYPCDASDARARVRMSTYSTEWAAQ